MGIKEEQTTHFKCTELVETLTETKHSKDMRPQYLAAKDWTLLILFLRGKF